ncbi:MAG: cyclic nucleotide-binding domain-containing protein [Chloroflexota bacterium]
MPVTIDIFKYEKNVEYFSEGEVIFKAGDEGHCMYVVQEGIVEVKLGDHLIDELGPGGVFGEMALVDNSPRSADVIAKTDCRVVPIDEDKFMSHVHRTPFFALQVMRLLAERLRLRMAEIAVEEGATSS